MLKCHLSGGAGIEIEYFINTPNLPVGKFIYPLFNTGYALPLYRQFTI